MVDVTDVASDPKSQQLAVDTQQADADTPLKSYFGVSQANTDDTLRAGLRGPSLIEDAHFREKVSPSARVILHSIAMLTVTQPIGFAL